MARSIKNRNVFSNACATAALAFAGPFALVGVYAAGANSQGARMVHTHPAQASSRTLTISGVPRNAADRPATIDDLMDAVPDPGTLSAARTAQSQSAQNTIVAQLNAFRDGNFDLADTYQSKSLRASFPSTRQFRITMSEVYPEFTAYKSIEFGTARADKTGRFVLVPTTLTGQDGVTVQALYVMVKRDGGAGYAGQSAAGKYQVMTVLGGMDPHPVDNLGANVQSA